MLGLGCRGMGTRKFDNFEPLYLGGVLLQTFGKLWEYIIGDKFRAARAFKLVKLSF